MGVNCGIHSNREESPDFLSNKIELAELLSYAIFARINDTYMIV